MNKNWPLGCACVCLCRTAINVHARACTHHFFFYSHPRTKLKCLKQWERHRVAHCNNCWAVHSLCRINVYRIEISKKKKQNAHTKIELLT